MGAGCAGSTVRYKGVNVNQIQFGDKLQGLPPLTGTRRPHRIYKRKAGGQKPGRDTIFCVNQLGGMMVKNSQFAANADGVKECSNRKNHRHHGHHMTNHPSQGQAHTAISSSVSVDDGSVGSDPAAFSLFGSFLALGATSSDSINPWSDYRVYPAGTTFNKPGIPCFGTESDLSKTRCLTADGGYVDPVLLDDSNRPAGWATCKTAYCPCASGAVPNSQNGQQCGGDGGGGNCSGGTRLGANYWCCQSKGDDTFAHSSCG